MDLLLLLGTGSLVGLIPLAVYLLYAARLNARTPPTLVRGPWDLGAVFLGLSGFLILAGPIVLAILDSHVRSQLYGNWSDLKAIGRREAMAWSLMATGYCITLGSSITLLLRARRPVTAVYNVQSASLEHSIIAVLELKGYVWQYGPGRIEICTQRSRPEGVAAKFGPGEFAGVQIETMPSTGHALIRWSGDYTGVRHDLETSLPGALTPSSAGRGNMSSWLYTAAFSVLVILFSWTVVVIILAVSDRHG